MLGSTVLEVAVGLTFCYATVALIVSTVQEALASALRLRARTLQAGVRSMLADPACTGLAQALYLHPLVSQHNGVGPPSYIEPRNFAIALIESLPGSPADGAQLSQAIDGIADQQLRRTLRGMAQRAGGDMASMEAALAAWFDTAMERVSAAYKRRSMMVSLLLSLLLAVLFNIDSIHLFRALWQHPALAAQLAAAPAAMDARALDALWRLPIGWHSFPPRLDAQFALSVAGWLLTASTALFGAPFWFNLMKRTLQVRDSGAKP